MLYIFVQIILELIDQDKSYLKYMDIDVSMFNICLTDK
jgi:hypothetical protein